MCLYGRPNSPPWCFYAAEKARISYYRQRLLRFRLRDIILCLLLGGFLFIYLVDRRYGHDQGNGVDGVKDIEVPSFLRKLRGTDHDSWQLVDWADPISSEERSKFNCTWTTFISSTGKQVQMCVHPSPDTISDSVRRKGRWGDCDILPTLWTGSGPDDGSIMLEMGANIGACVLEMLLSTKATIVAFEPHPMNVFNLKSTISHLDESMKHRLFLFPIGLGNETSTQTIRSGHNNMGNSMIGNFVPDGGQHADETRQFEISVERADAILNPVTMPQVRLTKMDVQGFECQILGGMGATIARRIDLVKFEYSSRKLGGQKCYDLMPRFREYGFSIYRTYGNGTFSSLVTEENIANTMLDLYASRHESFHV